MKNTILYLVLLFALSCKDDLPDNPDRQVPLPDANVAVEIDAGPDLTLILPLRTNFTPTIKITNPIYLPVGITWRQLAGPKINVNTSRLRFFEAGLYSFEISVGSRPRVYDIDTLNINAIIDKNCPAPEPIKLTKTVVAGFSHWGKAHPTALVDDKIILTSGSYGPLGYDPLWDITFHVFDVSDAFWSSYGGLNEPKQELASATIGYKVFFAGGNVANPSPTIEVYDAKNNKWDSIMTMSSARSRVGIAASGNKVFFAGGHEKNGVETSTIDIYDTLSKSWSVATLKESKKDIAAIAINNKVYFVGGTKGSKSLNTVEVYDIASGNMSSFTLKTARYNPILNSFNNKLFIAAGIINDTTIEYETEIFDINTGTSINTCLSEYAFASGPANSVWYRDKLYILNAQSPRGTIDIHDPNLNSWYTYTTDFNTNKENIGLFKSGNSLYLVEEEEISDHEYNYTVYKIDQ